MVCLNLQVYLGSTFENQYKLLARAGNKVQEVGILLVGKNNGQLF